MRIIFIYGGPAVGKYTVAKLLSERTGLPLFHNHLVVDAVHAVFPFGSDPFVRLREQFWMEVFRTAAEVGRDLIFTFQPEGSVAPDFPERVAALAEEAGGEAMFIYLTVPPDQQDERIVSEDRAKFGKMRDVKMLRHFRESFEAHEAAMPAPALTIDTGVTPPEEAAYQIAEFLKTV